ncbi:MAG: hypothetical protein HY748_13475 [Elusimicrobia bacterium]|nr:hypothetical protein [Elusimicrobiota bacterium]
MIPHLEGPPPQGTAAPHPWALCRAQASRKALPADGASCYLWGRMNPSAAFFPAGLLALLACAEAAAAQVDTLRVKELAWENKDCAATASCDLKGATFRAYDYRVAIGGDYSYGTGFSARYRTGSVGELPRYGFVQTVRGCQFDSAVKDGKAVLTAAYAREFFGDTAPFHHPRWAFDSVDHDPFYNSDAGRPRHYLYQWNRVPGSIDKRTREFYGVRKPPTPELYVLDYPGTAFVGGAAAKNISLEFETCLYRTSAVPEKAAPEPVGLAGALVCFRWSSSFVYDHARGSYETWDRVHPFCLDENAPAASAAAFKTTVSVQEDLDEAAERVERTVGPPAW